ncbi:SDR family oxidoreductase [Sandarakinorhabdus rubra]|uniref:SDR family oxidoreductase n=1 Tax=Sandarakinorhabdus rubra TaxID=2672568 RepID=UPI0013DAAC5F|nr:aldehyde reductase [Sandarakinorhabdus rubra]
MAVEQGKVLVTGASGYIAGFVIKALVREGWPVRGTIRSLARADEVRATLGLPDLELVACDLMRDDGWAEAMDGISHVQHIASPIPAGEPKDPDELIVPAREGALRALRFAHAAGVKRVVMTSSMAAIAYGHGEARAPLTESDWSNLQSLEAYAYIKSKTLAERAARDWMAANGAPMEYVSINPAAVLGPVLGPDFSTSLEVVKKLMDGALPGLPNLGFGVVDVRDVADLHVLAMITPGLDGERFIAQGRFMWMREVAQVLKDGLGSQARRVPTRGLPDWLMKLLANFDPTVKMVVPELGRRREASAAHALDRLGWRTRDERETILDCARSLIGKGLVKA